MALSFMKQAGLTELEKPYAVKATTGKNVITIIKVHSTRQIGDDLLVKLTLGQANKNENTMENMEQESWTLHDRNWNGKFNLFPILPPYTDKPFGMEIHWLPDSLVPYTPELHENAVQWQQPSHGIPNIVQCDIELE